MVELRETCVSYIQDLLWKIGGLGRGVGGEIWDGYDCEHQRPFLWLPALNRILVSHHFENGILIFFPTLGALVAL